MTLRQFIKACGGPEAAAAQIGVRSTTLWRWTTKRMRPKGNNLRRLVELGVKA